MKKEKLRTHSNEFEESYDNVAFMGARSMAQYPAIGRKLSNMEHMYINNMNRIFNNLLISNHDKLYTEVMVSTVLCKQKRCVSLYCT